MNATDRRGRDGSPARAATGRDGARDQGARPAAPVSTPRPPRRPRRPPRLRGRRRNQATLLGVALAYLALAVVLVGRDRFREMSALVAAAALAVGAIAAADALFGSSLSVVWAGAALAAVVLASTLPRLGDAGFAWLGVTVAELVAFDLTQLSHRERAPAAVAVGGSALLIAQIEGRRHGPRLDPPADGALVASVPCLFGGTVGLVGGFVYQRVGADVDRSPRPAR